MRSSYEETFFLLTCFCLSSGCDQNDPRPHELPRQVIYRFDEHRYLELEGFNCEGALWYNDTRRNIRTEVVARDTPIFRISFLNMYTHQRDILLFPGMIYQVF
ncbi:T6SS immunity protein Tli3 family protein [Salmonella enterica]|uniref:T6SS immunity protein Tli3 family protein n=1 Tax=Salmonella enterica TaxID=28901 RepID=UPI004037777F